LGEPDVKGGSTGSVVDVGGAGAEALMDDPEEIERLGNELGQAADGIGVLRGEVLEGGFEPAAELETSGEAEDAAAAFDRMSQAAQLLDRGRTRLRGFLAPAIELGAQGLEAIVEFEAEGRQESGVVCLHNV
jgi:hypothetical protein